MSWPQKFKQCKSEEDWWKTYGEYLVSKDWAKKRGIIIKRDGSCVLCGNDSELEVHHRRYTNVGNEHLNDLTTLCKTCHKPVTSMLHKRRYSKRQIETTDAIRVTPIIKETMIYDNTNAAVHDSRRITPIDAQR